MSASEMISSATGIVEALMSRMRMGQGMSLPYARKWDVGGCQPIHSLRTYPYDGPLVLAAGLLDLGLSVFAESDRLVVDCNGRRLWLAGDRSIRGEGPPEEYLAGVPDDEAARYKGNAPEVVVALCGGMSGDIPELPKSRELQIGFPGVRDSPVTYVGSWQWNVHGEADDDEFVRRAAYATLTAIEAKKERDAGHIG